MAKQTTFLPGFGIIEDDETGDTIFLPGFGVVEFNEAAGGGGGRIMGSIAGDGGLAGPGGIAGRSGGLAG